MYDHFMNFPSLRLFSVFSALKQKVPIQWFMVVYPAFLLVFSAISLGHPERMLKEFVIFFLYVFFDLLFTYVRDRVWYFPLSSWISAYILGIVALPDPVWWIVVALPLLAVISKQMLKFGKMRHVFNPAAFALAVLSFFVPVVSWWAVAWGSTVFWIVTAVGIFILWRQNRFHVALPFLVSYSVFLLILFLVNGIPMGQIFQFLRPQILDGTTLFFATVMLIEPLTSTFPHQRARSIYGFLVGFFAVLATYLGQFFPVIGDPLVVGLLFGNFVASMVFLRTRK